MVVKSEVEKFLRELLLEEYPKSRNCSIEAQTNLIATGIIDSFSFMEVLASLEERFGVSVDIGTHEFETLTTFGGLCDALAMQS